MNPVIFSIGNFEIRWYSVIMLVAFIVGMFFVNKEAKRFDVPKDFMFNMVFWALIFGIIGARAYYCLLNHDFYLRFPTEILAIRHGGISIHGAILGGLGIYQYIADFAGAGATVPLTGFGYNLAKGAVEGVTEYGFLGAFIGGVKNAAGGIAAAVFFGYIASLISKPKMKKQ